MDWDGFDPVFYSDFSAATLEPAAHVLHCGEEIDEYFCGCGDDVADDVGDLLTVVNAETGEAEELCVCEFCGQLFSDVGYKKAHLSRKKGGCDKKPRSRKGTKADKLVQEKKKALKQSELPAVVLQGKALENVFSFNYLGFLFRVDGDRRKAVEVRLAIAGQRFRECKEIWGGKQINLGEKLRCFEAGIVSVAVYGCAEV